LERGKEKGERGKGKGQPRISILGIYDKIQAPDFSPDVIKIP
jgi:hypothetical protein